MELLKPEERETLPDFYSQEDKDDVDDRIAHVKFFCTKSGWTWYGCEFNPKDESFYGLVNTHEIDWDYFWLTELQAFGTVVRDWNFKPCTIAEIRKCLEIFRVEKVEGGAFTVWCNDHEIAKDIPRMDEAVRYVREITKLPNNFKEFDGTCSISEHIAAYSEIKDIREVSNELYNGSNEYMSKGWHFCWCLSPNGKVAIALKQDMVILEWLDSWHDVEGFWHDVEGFIGTHNSAIATVQ